MPFCRSDPQSDPCSQVQEELPDTVYQLQVMSAAESLLLGKTFAFCTAKLKSSSWLLQATRSDLEARLLQREDEIERLKSQLEQGTVAESETEKSPEQRRKAEDARLRACQASVEAHIQELSTFLKDNGLEHVNPTGQSNTTDFIF